MKIKYILFALVVLASCSEDKQVIDEGFDTIHQYQVKAPSFKVHSADTRVSAEIGTERVDYKWNAGDRIGIFPTKKSTDNNSFTGEQVHFDVTPNAKNGGMTAFFDGGGWTVRKGYNYKAYYPFNSADGFGQDKTNMNINFLGQTYSEDNTLDNRIVMVADATANADNSLKFSFKPIVSIGVCRITLPFDATIESIKFECAEDVFCEKGTFNLEDDMHGVNNRVNTNEFTITSKQGVRLNKGVTLDWKFVQPPLQLKGKKVNISLISSAGVDSHMTFDKTIDCTTNWEAGNAYVFDVNIDLVFPEIHTINMIKPGLLTDELINKALNGGSSLKVIGSLNGSDLKILREAAGCTFDNTSTGTVKVKTLDLSEVKLLASEVLYCEGCSLNVNDMLGEKMFYRSGLTSIKLPKGINSIRADAFKASENLKEVNIPSRVGYISKGAFESTGIESIVIPDNVLNVYEYSFNNCIHLSNVTFSNGCDAIKPYTFSNCKALKSFIIPANVKTISSNAFKNSGLESLEIPATVTTIEENAFNAVPLTSLKINPSLKYDELTNCFNFATENCVLQINANDKPQIKITSDGKMILGGKVWKSIKDLNGNDLFKNLGGIDDITIEDAY